MTEEKEIRHLRWELESDFGVVAELRFDNQRLRELTDVFIDKILKYVDELQTLRHAYEHPPPDENPREYPLQIETLDRLLLMLIGGSTPSTPTLDEIRSDFQAMTERKNP